MVLNYSLVGDITVDVIMCKPAILNGQGEVIMSSSQWSDGQCIYIDIEFIQ